MSLCRRIQSFLRRLPSAGEPEASLGLVKLRHAAIELAGELADFSDAGLKFAYAWCHGVTREPTPLRATGHGKPLLAESRAMCVLLPFQLR
jgi:hypothetical protein